MQKKSEVISQNRISLLKFIVGYLKGKKRRDHFGLYLRQSTSYRGCIEYVALNTFRNIETLLLSLLFIGISFASFSTLSIKKKKKTMYLDVTCASSATRDLLLISRFSVYVEKEKKTWARDLLITNTSLIDVLKTF